MIHLIYGQDNPRLNSSLIFQENLDYKALSSTFYLVCQEYTIIAEDGAQKRRGSKNYFGRAFAVGVLSQDFKLWMPSYVWFPWSTDPDFRQFEGQYVPHRTILKIRRLEDLVYTDTFNLEKTPIDTTDIVLFFHIGKKDGIKFTDELIKEGILITFYASNPAPELKGDVSYSISQLTDLNWDTKGICQIRELEMGDRVIIGGALYKRIIVPGKIEWKLAGFYAPSDGKWVIKSVKMLLK